MSSLILNNALRFIGLVLLQVLVLQSIKFDWRWLSYLNIFIYPLFLILLPLRTPPTLQLLLGFVLGLTLDAFYNSLGIHASACVFLAFMRPRVLRWIQPAARYNTNHSPTPKRMGYNWFLRYLSIMLGFHLLFYFSVEAFTFAYLGQILLKTVASFPLSFIFMLILVAIFNPTD